MNASSPAESTDRLPHESAFRKITAIFSLVALLAVPALLLVVLQRSEHSRLLRAGESIPAAALSGVEPGEALRADINKKRTAILFFSADCPHCQWEMPIFNEAMKRFGSEVEFIAIALSDPQKTQAFVQANDIRVRVLIDNKGVVGRIFGISELPALFLVNQEQEIEWVGVGEQPRMELFRRLSMLAAKGPSTLAQGTQENRK
jgi:peroxiredoxin